MNKKGVVPDAWDDDWVSKADQPSPTSQPPPTGAKISKAERRAKQAELNRKLWEEAEAPKDSYFVQTRDDVPFKAEFKPAMKVLSRKPTSTLIPGADSSGLGKLTIEDDEDDDADEFMKKPMSMEERRLKAQQEREEKQRKYEEARQRLFGSTDTMANMDTSSGITASQVRPIGDSQSRGRNRGGRDSRPSSAAGNKSRQLYDPNHNTKPDSPYVQKEAQSTGPSGSVLNEEQPIRAPRGPDGSGRGGFGFANRGRGSGQNAYQ